MLVSRWSKSAQNSGPDSGLRGMISRSMVKSFPNVNLSYAAEMENGGIGQQQLSLLLELVKKLSQCCHERLITRVFWQDGVRSGQASPDVSFTGVVNGICKLQQLVTVREKLFN